MMAGTLLEAVGLHPWTAAKMKDPESWCSGQESDWFDALTPFQAATRWLLKHAHQKRVHGKISPERFYGNWISSERDKKERTSKPRQAEWQADPKVKMT